jgi:hypothetical protein
MISKGIDTTALGRWCWTCYSGKNNLTLRIIVAYHPNPPQTPSRWQLNIENISPQ